MRSFDNVGRSYWRPFHLWLVKRNRQSQLLSPVVAFVATFVAEMVQMVVILLMAEPFEEALALVRVIAIP